MEIEESYEARTRARKHAEYWERRAAGLCITCGKPASPGKSRCDSCAEKYGKRQKKKMRNPNALTEAVHELEEINNKRRAAGLPTLTYGQWQQRGGTA
jgi:hypothetical protein